MATEMVDMWNLESNVLLSLRVWQDFHSFKKFKDLER